MGLDAACLFGTEDTGKILEKNPRQGEGIPNFHEPFFVNADKNERVVKVAQATFAAKGVHQIIDGTEQGGDTHGTDGDVGIFA